jgi:hypothetical protein
MRRDPPSAFVLSLGITTALVTYGCAQNPMQEPQQRRAHKIPSEPSEAPADNLETPLPTETQDTPSAANKAKEDFQKALYENLRRLDEQIRELKLKAATLTEDAKAGWAEKQAELDAKRKTAEAKLGEIRSATGEAWEHLREGSQAAWRELEQAVKQAAEEF